MIDARILDWVGLLASFTFLTYSSWKDIINREVPDHVWFISYPVALVLLAGRLIIQSSSWMLILASIASALVLGFALAYLGLWGGADTKGLICLAIMNPLVPILDWYVSPVNPLFLLTVFSNAYIASLVVVPYAIQRNLRTRPLHELFKGLEEESPLRKAAAFLTGYRVPVEESLSPKSFLFPLESIDQQGSTLRRRFTFGLRVDLDPEKKLAEIKAAVSSGALQGTMWASPGLPFLVFMTVGFVVSVLFGDIVWRTVSVVAGAVHGLP